MTIQWDSEKISTPSLPELKQLLENAKVRNHAEVVVLCEAGLTSRKPKAFKLPDDFVRFPRSVEGKLQEAEVLTRLVEVALRLSDRFDLSAETARSLSKG